MATTKKSSTRKKSATKKTAARKSSRKTAARKSTAKKTTAKRGSKGRKTIQRVMHEEKHGQLRSGSGKKVTSRKQAIAIALSEARRGGAKIAPKKNSSKKK